MDRIKYENGQYFGTDANTAGPEVGSMAFSGGGFGDVGATQPVDGGFADIGATEPVGAFVNSSDETKAPTRPMDGFLNADIGGNDYSSETVPVSPGRVSGFTPVVGWLVCVDGPDRGNDYRIRTGYNQIGRSEHMDICIRGDQKISREKHALIAYDDVEKMFFFGPSEGRNIVRVNDKMVMLPTELHPYDTLSIGSAKLIFVPLCGENFDWAN
ncbi:MAG: FHA domain-containing protein [Lachnospiraceae bacterium]|nr:FHA domain-containing protein [Lachnospiraceae bacterium]